jgi:sugar lactone lactonase YvrE
MKRVGLLIAAALAAASCGRSETPAPAAETAAPAAAAAPAAPAALTAAWTVTDGIQTPESTYYDTASGSIFSSQIAGAPDGADGNGRIVKLDANGKVVNANFVTGLNAPKGLRVHNGTLWAADLGEVIGIDVNSGKITSRVKLDGAMFPNDVAVGADGTVYVSDMMGNKIYAVKDGKSSVFIEGEQLEHPNGLLVEGDKLVVGGWGSAPKADFSTDVPGHLFSLDLKTKAKTLITQQPFANIDGIEADGRGGYVVTDYVKGQVIRVSGGTPTPVASFMPGTADIGFMADHNMVIVPHMNENKVAAYTLP